ncbi:TPA: hypothetical protein OTR92_001313 [Staphylococcus aureus]|nr:hypothetical protein [Staphylococcus aureus]
MLTKQSQDFLEKLRVELLFRGKTEAEVEELLEELEDHLTIPLCLELYVNPHH